MAQVEEPGVAHLLSHRLGDVLGGSTFSPSRASASEVK